MAIQRIKKRLVRRRDVQQLIFLALGESDWISEQELDDRLATLNGGAYAFPHTYVTQPFRSCIGERLLRKCAVKEVSALRSKCALAATRIVNGAVERRTGDLHSVPMGLTTSEALFIATNINKLYNNSPLHLRVSGEKVEPFRQVLRT